MRNARAPVDPVKTALERAERSRRLKRRRTFSGLGVAVGVGSTILAANACGVETFFAYTVLFCCFFFIVYLILIAILEGFFKKEAESDATTICGCGALFFAVLGAVVAFIAWNVAPPYRGYYYGGFLGLLLFTVVRVVVWESRQCSRQSDEIVGDVGVLGAVVCVVVGAFFGGGVFDDRNVWGVPSVAVFSASVALASFVYNWLTGLGDVDEIALEETELDAALSFAKLRDVQTLVWSIFNRLTSQAKPPETETLDDLMRRLDEALRDVAEIAAPLERRRDDEWRALNLPEETTARLQTEIAADPFSPLRDYSDKRPENVDERAFLNAVLAAKQAAFILRRQRDFENDAREIRAKLAQR